MGRLVRWIRGLIRELRRRQVIRVAVVYATTGFVILQLAEILVDPFGLGPWALRLITLALILGFPLAVGLAWVYNLTGEGVVEIEEEATREDASGQSTVTPNGLIVGLLAIAIGLLLYPRLFSSGEEAAGSASSAVADTAQVEERSIAVLPFDPLSPDRKSKTFARGVHDDLLARLSNISALTVISRTSVERYRDTSLPLPAIADSLGVRWVMEGGVQKAGDQIQVRAQLIDPRTDGHVWTNDYQRRLTAQNLFAIQGEITQKIADALEAQLTAGEQERIAGAPTEDLTAYRLYAEGRRALSEQDLGRALTQFGAALSRDSSFALAWAGLADALGGGAFAPGLYRPDSIQLPDATQMEAARRALELDPDLAEAHSALGHAYLEARNAPAALREARRAVELKPSYAEAHQLLGTLLQVIGRFEEALQHFQVAEKLNPHHLTARHRLIDALMWAGKHKEALIAVREQQEMSDYAPGIWAEVRALHRLGRYEEAIGLARKRLRQTKDPVERVILHGHMVGIESESGDPTEARRHLRAMQQVSLPDEQRRAMSPLFMAAHARVGDFDAAFQAVRLQDWEDVVHHIALRMNAVRGDHPIRQDPRWDELMRKLNRHWGLNPDGSLPEGTDTSADAETDA